MQPTYEQLLLSEQAASRSRSQQTWDIINRLDGNLDQHETTLDGLMAAYATSRPSTKAILDYLEFAEHDSEFFCGLQMPETDSDEQIIGEGGKTIKGDYLFDRWSRGLDAGVLAHMVSQEYSHVWEMDRDSRDHKLQTWKQELIEEVVSETVRTVGSFNRCENTVREALSQLEAEIVERKQIVACTTTAAAKYTKQIQNAAPGIILVEEAGEILESHIITALSSSTRQLTLIGDHQQLRPKVNNYALTGERGEGYDLNRSLFERLILAGFPHTSLLQQHRMCPEISSLVRGLTYPHLLDAPATLNREPIKGIRNRVVFIDHRNPELAASQIPDRRDQGAAVSK